MSQELESDTIECSNGETGGSSVAEPELATETEGFDEGETLTEEMGEFVEDDIDRNDDPSDGYDAAPAAPAIDEALTRDGKGATTNVAARLRDGLARALLAGPSHEFMERLGSCIAEHIRRITSTSRPEDDNSRNSDAQRNATVERLQHMHALLQRHICRCVDESEAFEAMAEWFVAEQVDECVPVLAALTARIIVQGLPRGTAAPLPRAFRHQLIRAASDTAWTLIRRCGPEAIRVLPRIACSVARVACRRNEPAGVLPDALRGTVERLVVQPRLMHALAYRQYSLGTPASRAATWDNVTHGVRFLGPVHITILGQ